MKIRHSILLASALLLSWSLKAQEQLPANEVFEFLSFPRGVAQTGMAGAGKSLLSESTALAAFDNPAVLPFALNHVDATVLYGRWAPAQTNTLSNNLGGGVSVRLGKGFAVSAAVINQAHAEVDFGGENGKFSPKDLIVAFGAGASFGDYVSVGVSARLVQQQVMADYKLSSTAITAMIQYHKDALNVAAGLANLGSGVKSENDNVSSLPSSARVAASYELPAGPGALTCALDADYYFSGKIGVSAGVAYGFKDMLFARAGYRYASAGAAFPSHLALGLGAKWKGFGLDVSYLTANAQIGNSLCLGISCRF